VDAKKKIFLFLTVSLTFLQTGLALADENLELYRGVFHVQSTYSHDSQASLDFIRASARKAGLDFVVVTDHNTLEGMEHYKKAGDFSSPLLIFGNEISTVDGHLIALGVHEPTPGDRTSENLINWIHRQGGYAVLAHPTGKKKPWINWQVQDWDGMEVYNFADDFYRGNKIKIVVKAIFLSPDSFLSRTVKVPRESLKVWRSELKSRPVAAFGGANAHLKVKLAGWTPENFLLYLKSVTTYVYAESLDEKAILDALGKGRSFMALEALGSAKDFSYLIKTGQAVYGPGEHVKLETPAALSVMLPKEARIELYRSGELLKEADGNELKTVLEQPGTYHVEVYAGKKLWIYSNPIYVET
jgi:hypothetical protein